MHHWVQASSSDFTGTPPKPRSGHTSFNVRKSMVLVFGGLVDKKFLNDIIVYDIGCYDAAKRQQSSGQNDNDVLKFAYKIYFDDHKVKFNLEHAWIELRNDQKWCASSKGDGKSKKRKQTETEQSASSNTFTESDDQPMARPEGVKAAKARGKGSASKSSTVESDLLAFQSMWTIKKKDNDMKLLESIIGKKEPLNEMELALKNKLISDMLANK